MALCDVSRLDRFGVHEAKSFRQRLLAVGVTARSLHAITQVGENLADVLRGPIRRWHLRRVAAPLGPILRCFFFGDGVPESELRGALDSAPLFDVLVDAGVLIEAGEHWVSPFRLNLVNDLFIFTDDLTQGQEAVMGAGATTAGLIQAAWPNKRVASVLDVGCGAGTAALLMSSVAERAVGVDISQRALAVSALNARMAGLLGVEFVRSDLFSAVSHRQFDVIVSQPPFVSCPAGTANVTFLHGGARGDELALRLLAEVPPRLAPGGRGVFLVDWPTYDDVAPTDRIRTAIGEAALDVLVLLATPKNLDEHVTYYGSMMAPRLGPEFEDYVLVHREHLEQMGIRELRMALIVLRRTEGKPWTRLVPVRSMAQIEPTSAQIDRILAVQDLLEAGEQALLQSSLAVPPGTRFVERDQNSLRVELPDSRLVAPVVTSRAGADLLMEVDRAKSVADAVQSMFQRLPQLHAKGAAPVLAGIRGALQSGLLELKEPSASANADTTF
ncbi:MAG TPA: methyltransferase [Polyangiaceae bacterium]|nr:methyltransferase [Polyangiaceae bacterium]